MRFLCAQPSSNRTEPAIDAALLVPFRKTLHEGSLELLAYVLSRCVIDSESGCWHWTGCKHWRSGRPKMHRKGQSEFVDAVVWRAINGPIRSGMILVRGDVCQSEDCCNPAHRRTMSRHAFAQVLVRSGRASVGVRHSVACLQGNRNRKKNKLTLVRARKIRRLALAGVPRNELARKFRISLGTVDRVLRNETWREPTPWAVATQRTRPASDSVASSVRRSNDERLLRVA